jgi:hypothetical protein
MSDFAAFLKGLFPPDLVTRADAVAPAVELAPVSQTGASAAEPQERQELSRPDDLPWWTDWRGNWRNRRSDLRPETLSEPWREWYEERAAIREYDGAQARDEAEREALQEVLAAMAAAGKDFGGITCTRVSIGYTTSERSNGDQ